jgi:hypothetical protein
MSVSNGKITAPVSIRDIAQTIGDSSDVCKSPNINMWSARKPIRHPSRTKLTDAQMAQYNYGFAISATDDVPSDESVFDTDPNQTLNKAIASGGEWTYLRPRGSAYGEHSRILDFEGYNHYAPAPYSVIIGETTNLPNPPFDIWESDGCEIPIENLQGTVFGNDISNYRVALLYRKKGQTSGIGGEVYSETIGNSIAQGRTIRMYPNFPSQGEYDIVFAATEATSIHEDDMAWVYLPNTYKRVTYNPMSGVVDITLYHDTGEGFRVIYRNTDEVQSVSMRFYIRQIDVNYGPEAYIYAELSTASGVVLASASRHTEVDSEAFPLNGVLTVTNPASSEAIYTDELYIRVYYKFREFDTSDPFTTRYVDLIRNMSSENYVAPVTIQSVLNSL